MQRVLAVDLGGTKTAVGLVSAEGRVVDKETAPTPLGKPADVVTLIGRLAQIVQGRAGKAEALGLALPGVVDRRRGVLVNSASSGWAEVPFPALIAEAVGLEARADNDVNACAWAEARFGSGKGLSSFFWMTVSTGIGGAVVMDGRVVSGASSMAGEIGHLVVNLGGELCGCGHRGCLEAEAAGPAWRRRALRLLDLGAGAYADSCLAAVPRDSVDARSVAEGARSLDALCLEVLRESGSMLARGIAAVYTLLDPEAVFLGGGVAGAYDLLLPIIRDRLSSLVLASGARDLRIDASALGYDAGLVGAASLAIFPY